MVTKGCDTASEVRVTRDTIRSSQDKNSRGGEGDVDILGMSGEGVQGLSRIGWLGGKAS